jgi:hypothetical protein
LDEEGKERPQRVAMHGASADMAKGALSISGHEVYGDQGHLNGKIQIIIHQLTELDSKTDND